MNKKSWVVAGTIVGTYLFIATIVVAIVLAREYNEPKTWIGSHYPTVSESSPANDDFITMPLPQYEKADSKGSLLRPPARTNFLFIGVDHNNLADAIMVGTFYRDNGEIKLMSIPRDMYTHIPDARLQQMKSDGLNPPSSLKINAVRAFGGRNHGIKYLKEQLGEMLGVQFHYYIEVDLDAFSRIVDTIGGVTMYIPRRLWYSDPEQGLTIDIPAGHQHLDGEMAENVVRFRSFPTGDLMRNNIQMEFMSQLFKQTLTRDAIMKDPLALARVILSDVRTNANPMDLAKYVPYISRISEDSIQTFILPGNGEYRNGISWFIPNVSALPEVVTQVFYANLN